MEKKSFSKMVCGMLAVMVVFAAIQMVQVNRLGRRAESLRLQTEEIVAQRGVLLEGLAA